MATAPAFWNSSSSSSSSSRRRTSDENQQFAYSGYPSMPYPGPDTSDHRSSRSSGSSGTSSLSAAMGEVPLPASNMALLPNAMGWNQPQSSLLPAQSGYAPSTSTPFLDTSGYSYGSSPESISPGSPSYTADVRESFRGYPATTIDASHSSPHPKDIENGNLWKRVRDLERVVERQRSQIYTLESRASQRSSGSPPANSSPAPSAAFQASWRARTNARISQFCSVNRAGNALCAWHDSRRERRVYPPRMAPAGYLNCGCTFEEALFEESLARHHVGSYNPGETVRMDPALRKPLLKLLQTRYGYKDGDFERDARTGDWIPNEGPAIWEQQIQAGTNPRRDRHA
ncbi:unnamed protein product [Mycena citricolor]|uniref:Uncharacterized protein n=1 Tax=Mycena citricolor TaxID=2018698 RepID=A0AAD2HBW4_9AGAR|nr:unnamed protein product [Mycena citricolor]